MNSWNRTIQAKFERLSIKKSQFSKSSESKDTDIDEKDDGFKSSSNYTYPMNESFEDISSEVFESITSLEKELNLQSDDRKGISMVTLQNKVAVSFA